MEGTLEGGTVKEPKQEIDLKEALILNGVNGRYDENEEHFDNKDSAQSRLEMANFDPVESSNVEEMEQMESVKCSQKDTILDEQSESMEVDNCKDAIKDIEAMDVDQRSNSSEVECLDETNSDADDIFEEQNANSSRQSKQQDDNMNPSVETLSDTVECLENSSPLKNIEENGSVGSPEIEEVTAQDSAQGAPDSPSEQELSTPKKKQRKTNVIDLTNVTPRRSSRNIKRTSYIEKEDDEEDAGRRHTDEEDRDDDDDDDESDIEEIKPEDPLAVNDPKDRENIRNRSPKSSKTIVVNDTKRLVEIAAGSKANVSKGGKKEPTLVIIDTNSILSGRGGIPVSNSTKSSHSPIGSSSLTYVPMGTTTMYPNMRTTITPVPMKGSQLSPKSTSITPVPPPVQTQPAQPILPTLTDDMFVVEAPSFIVPYVYEKPPIKPLREFVTKLDKCIQEKEKEEREREKEEREKEEREKEKDGDEEDKEDEEMKEESDPTKPSIEPEKRDERKTGGTYFDLPLGKFFIQIGVNLVQEFVQTDLLRTQKRKQGKGQPSAETQIAINSLIKNLEFSKENNEPFHLELKKCEFCNFKTESSLVMQHHLETPHMRNYVYKCNFCPLEVRSPHDILFHMEAEHNTRGRLERGPAFHQCPNCPFEDNQKGKLTRHVIACTKKFRPERNLEPSADWEPPAKIPRINRSRPIGTANTCGLTMTMGVKGPQPLLPKLLPAPGRGRGRPPMQPRFADMKSMRPENVNPMMYRPTSSGLLVSSSYQFGGSQMFQMVGGSGTVVSSTTSANTSAASPKNPTAKLLSQPSISITPLPRSTPQAPITGTGRNTFVICEICDGYIKDLEQLRNHMQCIHKVKIHPKMIYNRPPLNCQKCQFRFFTDQGLERHLLGSHGLVTSSMQEAANKGKDAGRCPVCGRVYQWKLLNHVARDHGMTLKPAHLSYKCTVCTATFGMYKQFENHVYSAHSVVAKRMDKKSSAPSSPSSRSSDSLPKPLKINDEITIIPQPAAKSTTRSGNTATRPGK